MTTQTFRTGRIAEPVPAVQHALLAARHRTGISREKLAFLVDTDISTIARAEGSMANGRGTSVSTLARIINALRLTWAEFGQLVDAAGNAP